GEFTGTVVRTSSWAARRRDGPPSTLVTGALVVRAKTRRRRCIAVVVLEHRRGGFLADVDGEVAERVVAGDEQSGATHQTNAGVRAASQWTRRQAVVKNTVALDHRARCVPDVADAVAP